MIFTYMGRRKSGRCCRAMNGRSCARDSFPVKSYLECDYLQGIEGDFDSSHTSFLHNNNIQNAERLKLTVRRARSRRDRLRHAGGSIRKFGGEQIYVRTSPYIMPSFSIVPGPPTAKFEEDDIRGFRFWVPIDDTSSWLYILNMRKRPFAAKERKSLRGWMECRLPAHSQLGKRYLQTASSRARRVIPASAVNAAEQDGCATETMGAIFDRSGTPGI